MKKGMAKAVAFCMTAGLAISGSGLSAFASTHDATLVGVGTSTVAAGTEAASAEAETETAKAEGTESAESEAAAAETQTEEDRSMVGTTGFAVCDGQINVRASGDTEGEVLGVLNNNNAVEIEDVDENGWYKIRSGNVEGYVAGQYIATGAEAQEIADTAGYTTAEVGAEVLNVRADKNTDSDIVATATESDSLEVVQDDGDWLKVCIDHDTYGWVSADYVNASTQYSSGMTVAEESESNAQSEAEAAEAAYASYAEEAGQDAEAPAETYDASAQTSDASSETYDPSAESDDQTASDTSADAAYTDTAQAAASSDSDALYQAYLEAQEAAMHPVSEEDAEEKADAAVAAYQAYLQSLGVSSDTSASAAEKAAADTAADTASLPAETAAPVNTDVDSLYQAYLQAQDAANHPTDADDAQQKADAAIAAYNAYLAALGSSETVSAADTTGTAQETAETAAPETAAPETVAETTPETTPETAPETEETPASSLGSEIASYATQFVGNPYVYGGSSLTGGADCSGFTMAVFSHFGIGLPHNAAAQSGCGTQVSLSDIQPGDLLFYDNGGGIGHVTIYIGNGQVCHASNERTGITISSISYRNPVCAVRCW